MGISSNNNDQTYLSTLLMSLTHIESIEKYFTKENDNIKNKSEILKYFHDLINNNQKNECIKNYQKIFNYKHFPLNEEDFYRKTIYKLNNYFKELKKNPDNYKLKSNIKESQDNIKESIKTNSSDVPKNNESISLIEELFTGKKEVKVKCLECKNERKIHIIDNLIFSYDISYLKKDDDTFQLLEVIKKENIFECYNCHKITNHQIEEIFETLPKLIIIIIKNFKENIKKKFQLNQKINNEEYDLISFIKDKKEFFYKREKSWKKYDTLKEKEDEKVNISVEINNSIPNILIYESKSDIIKDKIIKIMNEKQENKKDYEHAVNEYKILKNSLYKKEDMIEGLYLISKLYFNNLLGMININLNNLNNTNENENENYIKEKFENFNYFNDENKKIQFLLNDEYNLKIIKNFDDLDKNLEIDFINKEIFNYLKIDKNLYEKEFGNLKKISEKNFQFKLKDTIKINIQINNKKKEISFVDEIIKVNANQNNEQYYPKSNINYENKNIIEENNQRKSNNLLLYIKPIALCFLEIDDLKNFFIGKNSGIPNNNNLASLLSKFINNLNNKNELHELQKISQEIENKIIELNKDIIQKLNFKNIIDLILNTIDKELNSDSNKNQIFDFQEYDKNLVYNKFKSFYYKNDSIISQLFYGNYCLTTTFYCCGLEKYQYQLLKYIYLDIQNDSNANLNNFLYHWENKTSQVKKDCNMCFLENQNASDKKYINKYPEILIIILENRYNLKIKFNKMIKFKESEYDLISCIITSEKDIIKFYNNSSFDELRDNEDNKQQIDKENETYISFPYVLFFKKNKKSKSKNNSQCINKNKEKSNEKSFNILKEKSISLNDIKHLNTNNNSVNQLNCSNPINNNINNNNNNISNFNNSKNIYYGSLNCDDIINQKKNMQINIQSNNIQNINQQMNNNMQNINNNIPNMNPLINNMQNMNLQMNNLQNMILSMNNMANMNSLMNNNIQNMVPSMNNRANMIQSMNNMQNFNNISNMNPSMNNNIGNFIPLMNNVQNMNPSMNNNIQNFNPLMNNISNIPNHIQQIVDNNQNINEKANNNIMKNYNNNNQKVNFKNNDNYIQNNNNNENNINFKDINIKNNEENSNYFYIPNNRQTELITLYFHFNKDQKELFLDINDSSLFSIAITELKSKYPDIKNKKIISYLYNGNNLNINKTIKENGIKDKSKIIVLEEEEE